VILVGAGPGDPDLLTLRGAAALREADAVVYDALSAPELLDLAPPHALRIDVGRRGHDAPTRSQPEITALLLELARAGRTVVRLKGGDPFVFGRGGEEASACAEAGIPFEVVPGVSSAGAALAYAGIPLTDRRHSASFAVVTGHKDPTKVAAETRWELLARSADTLVILMGMRNLEEIVGKLLAAGRAPGTPAAVVMNGTLPSQRVVEAPLGELAARVRAAGLAAPAVIAVGDVVQLRRELSWFEALPLFGLRVLVTRPEGQAGPLLAALRRAGAEGVHVPLLRLLPAADPGPLDAALAELASYDGLLLTSANAARFLAERAATRGLRLAAGAPPAWCVGPRTAEAARAAGLEVAGGPEGERHAAGLLAELAARLPLSGRRFLFPCAEGARETLASGLRAAGARVDRVTAYRSLPPDRDPEPLRQELRSGRLQALTFTSPSTVAHFSAMLDPGSRAAAERCLVAAVGAQTAQALERAGLAAAAVAERAGAEELVAALAEAAAARPGGGRG
jgi:uroporphyrinogen III methyltransferase/synthase